MNDIDETSDGPRVGYRNPPQHSRFKKGRSGNPRGRPRGSRREVPYDTVLGQTVTIREEGRERRVTAAEAFLLHITRKGLAGDNAAARASLGAIEAARAKRGEPAAAEIRLIRLIGVGFGVSTVLDSLGLGKKLFSRDEARVRWLLQPWIVQAALARLGSRRLSIEEQREVWSTTRTPEKVSWPSWWTERG